MVRKILFCVNTYFQLITAIKILNNFKGDVIADLCVSDHSYHAKAISDNCKKVGIFRSVFFAETRKLDNISLMKHLYLSFEIALLPKKFLNKYCLGLKNQYDTIFFHNLGKLENAIYNQMSQISMFERFEEGYSCYVVQNEYSNTIKMNNIIRKMLKKKILLCNYEVLFLYHPKILCYKTNVLIQKIPLISERDREQLNVVFNYTNTIEDIHEKYIYLGGAPNGNENIDIKLIKKIQEVVGTDNVIVKPHPRTNISLYSDLGIKIFPICDVPWELIQMNIDFSGKVFITISSSAALSSRLYFNQNIKSIFLYRCVQLESQTDIGSLDVFLKKIIDTEEGSLLCPTSIDELEEICIKNL